MKRIEHLADGIIGLCFLMFLAALFASLTGFIFAIVVNSVFLPIFAPTFPPISGLQGFYVFVGFGLLRLATFWLP
jgi:hypothetical protein